MNAMASSSTADDLTNRTSSGSNINATHSNSTATSVLFAPNNMNIHGSNSNSTTTGLSGNEFFHMLMGSHNSNNNSVINSVGNNTKWNSSSNIFLSDGGGSTLLAAAGLDGKKNTSGTMNTGHSNFLLNSSTGGTTSTPTFAIGNLGSRSNLGGGTGSTTLGITTSNTPSTTSSTNNVSTTLSPLSEFMNSASNVIRNNSMPMASSSSSSATNTDFAAVLSRAAAVGGAVSNAPTTTTTGGGLNNKNQVFKIANEDFPALPGSSTSISINATTGSNPSHNGNSHHPSFVYSSSSEDGGSLFPQQFLFQQQQQHQPSLDHSNAPLTGSSLLALLANPSSSNNPSSQQQQQNFLLPSSSTATASSPALVSKIMGSTISSSNTPLRGNSATPTASAPTTLSSSSSLPTTTVTAATTNTTSSTVGSAGSGAGVVLSGEYGLLGLLGRIRVSSDEDCNLLALGSDLTCLELELNSPEPLYKTFSGPWSTSSYSSTEENSEPLYAIPSCYYVQPIPALKTGHLAKFQLETLFYIFYGIPQDILQAYAAQELYSRDWRFHADFQLWMKPIVLPNDSNNGNNNNNGTGTGNATTPTQQFIYFDTHLWERRLLNTGALNTSTTATSFLTSATANNSVGSTSTSIPQSAPNLTNMFVLNGFLSEEDIRVKVVTHHT